MRRKRLQQSRSAVQLLQLQLSALRTSPHICPTGVGAMNALQAAETTLPISRSIAKRTASTK